MGNENRINIFYFSLLRSLYNILDYIRIEYYSLSADSVDSKVQNMTRSVLTELVFFLLAASWFSLATAMMPRPLSYAWPLTSLTHWFNLSLVLA